MVEGWCVSRHGRADSGLCRGSWTSGLSFEELSMAALPCATVLATFHRVAVVRPCHVAVITADKFANVGTVKMGVGMAG